MYHHLITYLVRLQLRKVMLLLISKVWHWCTGIGSLLYGNMHVFLRMGAKCFDAVVGQRVSGDLGQDGSLSRHVPTLFLP